ncbi:TetR/AcrR family transcriptional regulator [Rhizobium sp. WW_1]|jgi:AcrR family transcriptional regulator|uniref:TetR/AcrR family transcriptional regulator n=1 Tax=Rhizobium sp. WW_1 TaxID=1907375 RepID=UPI0009E03969|nr:TetR/AcrR family transcriptional regulator [Rhizobium sp. WW_1]
MLVDALSDDGYTVYMSTRIVIINCALDELQAVGLDKLSLRAVGKRVGITPMAVYRHFQDKADLLHALGEHALSQWRARVEQIEEADLRAWFNAVTYAFVEFALDSPALFDAAFVLSTRAERIYPHDFIEGRSPVIGAFTARLASGQQRGLVRQGDALEIAMMCWGLLQGLVGMHRSGRFNLSREDFTGMCLRAVARIIYKD